MTQEALVWMIVVQALVTISTAYLFYKVLKKDGDKSS